MTPEREARLLAVLGRRQMDLTLITDQVHKARNISALVRNCDAVGISDMHFVEPKEGYRTFRGTTMGSDRWVELHRHATTQAAIRQVKRQGMQVFAAHLSADAVDFHDVDYTQPCAILMGAEKAGVSAEAAKMVDQHIVVPMLGMVDSLNVATASGIILVEAQRQRLQAGMYQRSGLDPERTARYLFEARYPRIVEFCRLCEEPYPDYTARGELVDPEAVQPLVSRGLALQALEKRPCPRNRSKVF
ncbi:MAG TPA: tRNA (guanosine(18)-2'-O)-methyltransferase TrmH [Marinobacterium sp.]|nr:tRNA (guanosine(18)-2'-O)-methyltransferase TrmH [Marinobacterium sp.]